MKKVIIFDFDNTIVLSLEDWKYMIDHETAKHYNVEENPDFEPNRHGLSNKDTARLFLKMHNLNHFTVDDVINYWYPYMEEKYRNNIDFLPGAKWALETLKNKGYKLVLATATGRSLLSKVIKIFDVEKYFDYIICEEEVGKSKMEPDIYYKIFENVGARAEDCLYFEDSSVALTTASKIGIDCVAVISKLNEHKKEKLATFCKAVIREYNQEIFDKLGL